MVGLPDGEKTLRICRLVSIPACDRQTDGQTYCHGFVRAIHMCRAVKVILAVANVTSPPINGQCINFMLFDVHGTIITCAH